MKSTYKVTAVLLTSIALLSSCKSKSAGVDNPTDHVLKVISSDISWSRTNGDAWRAGDEIGIYAFDTGEKLSDASLYDGKANVKFVTKEGNGVFVHSNAAIPLPRQKNIDVIAYYPFRNDITGYRYAFDNTDQSNHSKIDVLYARAEGFNFDHYEATITFSHVLTKLDFIIDTNGHDLGTPTVTCDDITVDGTLLIADGSVTTGTKNASPSIVISNKNDASMMHGSMVLPPQTYQDKKVTLTIGDKKIESVIPTFTTKSGYRYELMINYIHGGSGKAQMQVTAVNISNWNKGNEVPPVDTKEPEVTVEVTEVSVSPATTTLKIGQEVTLACNVMPDNATDKTVIWHSSNEHVATVVDATVKALTAGEATITAISRNGTRGTCTVTVTADNDVTSIDESQPYIRISLGTDGSKDIYFYVDAVAADRESVWIDLNGDGKKGEDENIPELGVTMPHKYTALSQDVTFYGNITKLDFIRADISAYYGGTNAALKYLNLANTGTAAVITQGHPNLEYLNINGNQLYTGMALDVSTLTKLRVLDIGNCQTGDIDFSRNTELRYLNVEGNKLTKLDISAHPYLTHLICSANNIKTLDISKATGLLHLEAARNKLSTEQINMLLSALSDRGGKSAGGLWIANNPGTRASDLHIAASKNWTIDARNSKADNKVRRPIMDGEDW